MLAAGYDMNALVLDFPRADRRDGSSWETTLAAFEAARSATGAPAAVVASLPETMPEAIAGRLVAAVAHRDTLIELDVNPLLVFATGSAAVAVDASASARRFSE